MRREFASVLAELSDGLADSAARGGARLVSAEMTLPMDLLVVAHNGGLTLLADVPRTRADDAWRDAPSRVRLTWQAIEAHEADLTRRRESPAGQEEGELLGDLRASVRFSGSSGHSQGAKA